MRVLKGFLPTLTIELISQLRRWRLWLLSLVFALAVVAGALGISGNVGPPPENLALNLFAHVYQEGGTGPPGIVAWVADAWGGPRQTLEIELLEWRDQIPVVLAISETDAEGFSVFRNLTVGEYTVTVAEAPTLARQDVLVQNSTSEEFSLAYVAVDLENSGAEDDLLLHAMDRAGTPALGAVVQVNGVEARSLDRFGFGSVTLGQGLNNVTVTFAGKLVGIAWFVPEAPPGLPYQSGPDATLALLALVYVAPLLSIASIALSFDSIARERGAGTLDLLLSRPVTRLGFGLGKLLGVDLAILLPLGAVLGVALGIVSIVSGRAPSSGLLANFVVGVVFLVVVFTMMQQVLSSRAKSVGTALFTGIFLWILFHPLYPAVTYLVGLLIFGQGSREFYLVQNYGGLANPVQLFQDAILAGAQETQRIGGALFGVPPWAVPLAMGVWLSVLLWLHQVSFRKLS